MHRQHIIIAGAGGIGKAAALFLANGELPEVSIHIGDRNLPNALEAADWVRGAFDHQVDVKGFLLPEEGTNDQFDRLLAEAELLLDCLPGSQAPRMAGLAREYQLHYANLTEYVKETQEIIAIAEGAETGFVLQTGLAPGYINILANSLYRKFADKYKTEKVEHIVMRVGALTKHCRSPHFYGFTWSPIGVATEYVKDCIAIRDFKRTSLPSLSDRESMIIDGVPYEADLTSGGAADLAKSFEGIARKLDYKTVRYPGHFNWVESIIQGMSGPGDKIKALETAMLNTIPVVKEDVVVIFASVVGQDTNGQLRAVEKSLRITPVKVGKRTLSAIQATTAAPLVECAKMLLAEKWTGVVFQSQINAEEFLAGPFVSTVYGKQQEKSPEMVAG